MPPAAALNSPCRHRHRLGMPLASGGDFELRHWRPAKRAAPPSRLRERWAVPEIEIATGGGGDDDDGHRYTSLRDILSSPEYAAAVASSPAVGGDGSSCGDIHISNPLVKHAAHAYLQPTPSAMSSGRRRRRRSSPLGRILRSCLGFVGALFHRR